MQLSSLSLSLTALYGAGFAWRSLFADGTPGFRVNVEEALRINEAVGYDPSKCVIFQDSAGTLPVTAMEQPLGLILDTKLGVPVRGPEIFPDPGADDPAKWSGGSVGWTVSGGFLTGAGVTAYQSAYGCIVSPAVIPGKCYEISYEITSYTSGAVRIQFGGVNGVARSTTGVFREFVIAKSTTSLLGFQTTSTFTGTIDNISVREVPGNHFIQPDNTASRPIVSRRVNLMQTTTTAPSIVAATVDFSDVDGPVRDVFTITKTEEGTNKGHVFVGDTTISAGNYSVRTVVTAGGVWQFDGGISFGVKFDGSPHRVIFGPALAAGWTSSIQVTPIGGGWFEVIGTFTATTTLTSEVRFGNPGDVSSIVAPVKMGEIDFRLSIDANLPPYQRVTSSTDYDEVGFPAYARFDGLDDWLESGVVDMTSTDAAMVIAGVAKLSDAAAGVVIESSVDATSNAGAIALYAPDAAAATYEYTSRGTASADATASGQEAPRKSLLSGVSKISTDTAILRVNRVPAASSSADQGTGNYGAHKFYMGRRAGTSNPFNGRIYGVTVIGKLLTDGQLAAAEQAERNLGRLY